LKETEAREVAFYGKITAGVTHEFRNVLAIIRESAGLLQDLLSLSDSGALKHRDKWEACLERISQQVDRGTTLADRLNRFSHSPDHPTAQLDLREVLDELLFLSRRFARGHLVDLDYHPNGTPLSSTLEPPRVFMALFGCIECAVRSISGGGTVAVEAGTDGSRHTIRFHSRPSENQKESVSGKDFDEEEWRVLRELFRSLGGDVESRDGGNELICRLPVRAGKLKYLFQNVLI
jgi:signal transduction histidine kinase